MINEIIEKIADIDFNQKFIIDDILNTTYTYNEFFTYAYKYSLQIDRTLVKSKKIVVVMENSAKLAMLYFSTIFLNKEIAVIDPKKGKNEISEILNDLKVGDVIADENVDLQNFTINNVCIDENIYFDGNLNIKELFLNALKNKISDDKYLITFTSGTTGKTKGVLNSLSNLLLTAYSIGKKIKNNGNIFLHVMPMTYMAGILNSLFYPLLFKMQIVIVNRFSIVVAHNFWDIVCKYSINSFWLSPSMLLMIEQMDRGEKGIEYCKLRDLNFLIGTASLPYELRTRFNNKYGVELHSSYGLSETLFISVETEKSIKNANRNCVGELLDEVDYKIDSSGELLVYVPWMFNGYTNVDTKKFFENKYYRTGDLVYIENNYLYVVGRTKDLIVKGGMNISPTLIENVIMENFNITETVVFGVEDKNGQERICCYYCAENNIEEQSIKKCILEKLGVNYSIDYLLKIDSLPRNFNGKIDKFKLQKLWSKRYE